ncbi:hypothetical protein H7849_06635 [Alloacidobacterium dinghuense]|uniref:Uncharacterized protein n=1 Tax=Alloacidobacterium dinghuense TaxID=2763107 RepID=A0A7G8BM40_9BACT|nr:hypothetical protein [Alloacidobacterium dinghuense]QNI33610.1 hypothetical protein H7849_06635 [Alloacidobacterium dinghuense]
MKFPLAALVLWAAGFVEHAGVLLVLIVRKRWRTFPIFTALMGFNALRTIVLVLLWRQGNTHHYWIAYYWASIIDLALQLGIIFELARVVLKPTGTWIRDAGYTFLLCGLAGAAVAAGIAYFIHPISDNTFDVWVERGQLFSAMLTLELFASMLFASTRLGLLGTSHVMRLGQGWAVWAIADLVSEGIYSHFGPDWHYLGLIDSIRILAYQAVTIYWIVTLWRPEPIRRTLSAEMQAYLDGLHVQLQSDLKQVSSIEKH